jgi:hypothetical protein
MAPQVGLEPTTVRLTAECSTTELLRNNYNAWRRPTLTGTRVPTTIGAEELNFRVRNGNGCGLFAIVTRRFCQRHLLLYRISDIFQEKF